MKGDTLDDYKCYYYSYSKYMNTEFQKVQKENKDCFEFWIFVVNYCYQILVETIY